MKVRDTSPGRLYALSSEIGCTAINGAMAADIPAGGQVVILALDKKIVIDGDDAAKFVEVRWGTNTVVGSRPVPAWLSDVLSGLISIVGDDKFDISYMPAENKLVVHTDRVDDTQYAEVTNMLERFVPGFIEVVQYNHNMEISWRDINKYAACTNIADMVAVNPDYKKDLTSDGAWVYPLPAMVNLGQRYPNNVYRDAGFSASEITSFLVDLPSATNITDFLRDCRLLRQAKINTPNCKISTFVTTQAALEEIEINMPIAEDISNFIMDCPNLKKIKIYAPKAQYFTAQRNPQLETIDGEFPSLVSQTELYGFLEARLDKESTLRILRSIPAYSSGTHLLLMGIHIDHQNDEEVWAAISNAEVEGWTLKVRWNPGGPTYTTPEATTFGLLGTLIYAKVSEYELPDGTTEQFLDWGHYVTNWEERGYEQFRSLESAYRYFNLPMPEVETEPSTEEELQIEDTENA